MATGEEGASIENLVFFPPMRPYAYLARAVAAQVKLEERLNADDSERIFWTTVVKFAGTRVTIGKVEIRTYFWQLGNGERKQGSYVHLQGALRELGKQPYPVYRLQDKDRTLEECFYLKELRARPPHQKNLIIGVNFDGSQEYLFRAARRSPRGLAWIQYISGEQ
jgi:hypothetical protein